VSDLEKAIDVIQKSGLSDADKGKLARTLRLLDRRAADMHPAELREARELAGLSLGQAAKLIGIPRPTLEHWEQCGTPADSFWNDAINRVYGLGRPAKG
jgi:DNA-binding transcriptional regulator YiaG